MNRQKRGSRAYRRGVWAEFLCRLVLLAKGYRLLASRYKTPHGEVDIVAKKGSTLLFVEVKARSSLDKAAESITPHQRKRIERAAAFFLAAHPAFCSFALRFDAMLAAPFRLPRHIERAWESET